MSAGDERLSGQNQKRLPAARAAGTPEDVKIVLDFLVEVHLFQSREKNSSAVVQNALFSQ